MRLIDADRLKYYILQEAGDTTLKENVKCFLQIIDKMPTVPDFMREKCYCNHDCDALYEAYEKGKEGALKENYK